MFVKEIIKRVKFVHHWITYVKDRPNIKRYKRNKILGNKIVNQ